MKDQPDARLDRVLWAMRRTEISLQALKEQRLRPLGMTLAYYGLLLWLHANPGLAGAQGSATIRGSRRSWSMLLAGRWIRRLMPG